MFQNYLMSDIPFATNQKVYIASEKDYTNFAEQFKILSMFNEMKGNKNYDSDYVLCYAQPILDIHTKTFRTAEALVRMQSDGNIIYPDKFIHIAEKLECIHTLTCIMINKVCQEIKKLEAEYDFDAITINCSTQEFTDMNFHTEVLDIIRSNNISPSKICLELTESAITNDYDTVLFNINKLREAGINFYLDDFGTGYSNLERIITCPFKTIKFDKSLLYKSLESEPVKEFMQCMVNVLKKQNFLLLVEGVENDEHDRFSVNTGFDYIQGYKYSKPLPIDQLCNFFSKK